MVSRSAEHRRYLTILAYFLILGVAVFFRVYLLPELPAGLYGDEAFNGIDALETATSRSYPVFYAGNSGREGMLIWLTSLVLQFQEPTAGALRMVSAGIGIFTVALVPFAVAALAGFCVHRRTAGTGQETVLLGLIVMALISVSYWHFNFSRVVFRAILDPFFAVLSVTLVCLALQRARSLWLGVVAGIVAGMGVYGYAAYKFMILPFCAIAVLGFRTGDWRSRQQLLIIAFSAIVVSLPLLHFIMDNPQKAFGRFDVSVFATDAPLRAFVMSSYQVLQAFFAIGDGNARHNLVGEPHLHPVVFVFFFVGLWWSIAPGLWERLFPSRSASLRSGVLELRFVRIVLIWWLAMLIPAVMTHEAQPHALRSIGMIVPSHILAGVGMLLTFRTATGQPMWVTGGVLTLLLLAFVYLGISGYTKYFIRFRDDPTYAEAFFAQRTDAARYLAEHRMDRNLVVLPSAPRYPADWLLSQFRFFTANDPSAFDIVTDDKLSDDLVGGYENLYLIRGSSYRPGEAVNLNIIYY